MYIYCGKHFDRNDKDLGGAETYVKIGKTVNLDQREYQLNATKSPIGYAIVKAFETGEDTDRVEKQLHAVLPARTTGEWFDQDEEDQTLVARVSKFMLVGGYPEVDLGLDDDEDVNKVRKEETDWVEWREFFQNKLEEHPEWFKTACRNWAYTGMTLSKNDQTIFNVIVGAQTGVTTTGKFDVKVEIKGTPIDDDFKNHPEVLELLKKELGDKCVQAKLYCRAIFDSFDEAFEHYKKIITASKNELKTEEKL